MSDIRALTPILYGGIRREIGCEFDAEDCAQGLVDGGHAEFVEAGSEAIPEPEAPEVVADAEPDAPVDAEGTVFDPEKHRVDKSGAPIINKDGSFRKRPRR